jgi:hypothetical protein
LRELHLISYQLGLIFKSRDPQMQNTESNLSPLSTSVLEALTYRVEAINGCPQEERADILLGAAVALIRQLSTQTSHQQSMEEIKLLCEAYLLRGEPNGAALRNGGGSLANSHT